MSLIYVAGSGPSGKGHRFAHVVTKKKAHWDFEHIVLPRSNWITVQTESRAVPWDKYPRRQYWTDYYAKFSGAKMSNGLMAICVAIDTYQPDEICLIGFDNILNSAKATQHKWGAELKCIESLVKIR
jgi:hypothetical protein